LFGLPGFWLAFCFMPGARRALNLTDGTGLQDCWFLPAWFGTSAEIATIKLNEIEDRSQESLTGYFASNQCTSIAGSSSSTSVAINAGISGE
jgi:hypothetical protein